MAENLQQQAQEAEQARDRLEQGAMVLFAAALLSARDDDPTNDGTDTTHLRRLLGALVRWYANALRLPLRAAEVDEITERLMPQARIQAQTLKVWMRDQPDRDPGEMSLQRAAARGFSTTMFNATAVELAQTAEPTLKKVWITRKDPKVRLLHRKLHGRAKDLDEDFWRWPGTGQRLAFPGDTRAPMDAWIGCRCVLFITAASTDDLVAAFPAMEDETE